MSRRPRFQITDLPIHVVQRGNDRQRCFFDDRDRCVYLKALAEAAASHRVLIHAYALMTNHVHLLLTPRVVGAISRLMQSVGARYVWYVNETKQRTGTLWEGRYKACLVASDRHVLAACRYIDLNPVRAGIVAQPSEFEWSSYGVLAGLRPGPLVTPHESLAQLGDPRGPAYARWCAEGDHGEEADRLREATQRELAYGSEQFKAYVEAMTTRATTPRRRGRPRRTPTTPG